MRRLAAIVFAALPLAIPSIVWSQASESVWYTLDISEGSVITAAASITLRYGQVASTCAIWTSYPCNGGPGSASPESWTAPQTFAPAPGSTTSVVVGAEAFNNMDPLPGVRKTVQIAEQATTQNITIDGQSILVPGLSSGWFLLDAWEGSVITAATSITLRYGQVASTCAISTSYYPCNGNPGSPSPEAWTAPPTFTPAPVSVTVGAAAFNNVDPLFGVRKTVQIEQRATPQNITVNGQPITIPGLTAASACQLTATPASITFPDTMLGYSYSSIASIVNSCPTVVALTSVQVTSPYSASGFEVPILLAPGQTQDYTVVFTPTTTGASAGSTTFAGDPTTVQTLSVPLTGAGAAAAAHFVALSWDGVGSQIAGYNIHRSLVSGGPYSTINSAPAPSTNYTDQTVVAGATYFYTVTAVDITGAESGYSNEISAVIPNP
jgi:hypothetical protein